MRSLRLLIVSALVGLAQPVAATAVDVAEPGWHALKALYFESTNTSTLFLKWRPPGAAGFDLVPANSLKHLGTP